MLIDKLQEVLDSVDHAGTLNGELDLGDPKAAYAKPITMFFQGEPDAGGAVVAASTPIVITLTSRSTSGSGGTAIATFSFTAAQANQGFSFIIPSHCARYAYFAITGTITAGAFSLFMVTTPQLNSFSIS
jgi:hypothetical protein